MAEENEEVEVKEPPVVEQVEAKLDDPKDLSTHDLESLRNELKSEIRSIRSDKTKDAEDKAQLEAKIDKLQEHLQHLIEAQEERDKKHNDESTIVVPPKELDPPTHQNQQDPDAIVQQENQNKPRSKKGLRWW